jgi:hypothetical protein
VLTLKILGFLFVAIMAVCWIRPSFRYLFQETPPAIVTSAYSFITIYGLLLGLHIIYFKELEGSIQQYLENIFQNGVLSGRTSLVLAAVFVSLCFVLANLTRSYYNLHNIENARDGSALRRLICEFRSGAKVFEGTLRFLMFVTIVLITKQIASINKEIPNSGSLPSVKAFRNYFDGFWHLTTSYYILLIVWDAVIWVGNRHRGSTGDSRAILKVVWLQALPVHIAGLIVSLMLCLPRHFAGLAPYVDLCSLVALLAAIVGCVFLIVSAVLESPELLGALHFRSKSQPAEQGPQSAESEA